MSERFRFPGRESGELEYTSLREHSKFFQKAHLAEEPREELKNYVLFVLEKAYELAKIELPSDFLSREHFMRCVHRLDWQSSPGYPFTRQAPTIGEWLKIDGLVYDQVRLEELWYMVNELITGDEDLLLSVFVKPEPHKIEKVENGRWRLIMVFPLHHQILWHMVFADQNDKEIELAYEIPSQQGISLFHGGWKNYTKLWKSRRYDVGLDKKAWDWTVSGWLTDLELELRSRLVCGSNYGVWRSLASKLYKQAYYEPRLLLSDGRVFKQVIPGMVKSGCVNTISTNSHMQMIIHVLACVHQGVSVQPLPVAVGDDTLQRMTQSMDLSAYNRFGVIVKSVTEGLEFVGMDFTDAGPIPLYHEKHLFKAMSLNYDDKELIKQYFDSMLLMYVHCRYYKLWEHMAFNFGVGNLVRSRNYYLYLYDHPEC